MAPIPGVWPNTCSVHADLLSSTVVCAFILRAEAVHRISGGNRSGVWGTTDAGPLGAA
jgi:hypothetical protein